MKFLENNGRVFVAHRGRSADIRREIKGAMKLAAKHFEETTEMLNLYQETNYMKDPSRISKVDFKRMEVLAMIRLEHARHGRNAALRFLSVVKENTEDHDRVRLHFLARDLYKTSAVEQLFAKNDWSEYLNLLVFGRRDCDLSHGDPAGWMRDSELVAVGEMDVWA